MHTIVNHTCMYIYIYVYMYICICVYMYICVYNPIPKTNKKNLIGVSSHLLKPWPWSKRWRLMRSQQTVPRLRGPRNKPMVRPNWTIAMMQYYRVPQGICTWKSLGHPSNKGMANSHTKWRFQWEHDWYMESGWFCIAHIWPEICGEPMVVKTEEPEDCCGSDSHGTLTLAFNENMHCLHVPTRYDQI